MWKKTCFFVLTILISACSITDQDAIQQYKNYVPQIQTKAIEYDMYQELFQSLFNTPISRADVLGILVSIEIDYSSEQGEYWKSAEETWSDKTGDCEDFCTLFLGLLMHEDLYSGQTMIVINPNQGDPFSYHVKIADRDRGLEYELTGGLLDISPLNEARILQEYSYSEVMYQAYEKRRLDWIF